MVNVIDNNLDTRRVDQVPPAVQMPAVDIDKQVYLASAVMPVTMIDEPTVIVFVYKMIFKIYLFINVEQFSYKK